MDDVQLALEEVFALPEPSIQAYLQFKGWPSQNFLADRITVMIYYTNDGWLGDADRAFVRLKNFTIMANLPDAELITRLQEMGEEVTALMTRFDLVRKLLEVEVEFGNIYSFGTNTSGQLGLGDILHRNVPTLVTDLDDLNVGVVSCGNFHTVIITKNGDLYSFGDNGSNQLGLGNDILHGNVPTLVTIPDSLKVKAVNCGDAHTVIITENGNIYSFGNNVFGQLGLDDDYSRNIPTLVTALAGLKAKAVSCGDNSTAIITEDNDLYSFGDNAWGQLGLDDEDNRYTPTLVSVPGSLKVKAVSCGGQHTVIITEDGNLYSFGKNDTGQLGLGDRNNRDTPRLVNVPGGLGVKAVSCGGQHTAIITENGNLYSFGYNLSGQLGLGNRNITDRPTLVNVPDSLKVKAVSCGNDHTVIITENDNLYSFGSHDHGQLGLGPTIHVGPVNDKLIPTLVNIPRFLKAIAVSCGWEYTVVIAK